MVLWFEVGDMNITRLHVRSSARGLELDATLGNCTKMLQKVLSLALYLENH